VDEEMKKAYGSKMDLEKPPLLKRPTESKPKKPTLVERIKKVIKKETGKDENE